MDTTLQIARTADGYLIRVLGKGTMHPSHALQAFAESLERSDECRLAIDLNACEKVDSTFLGCLVALQKSFGGKHGDRFEIVASSEVAKTLLGPLKMTPLFSVVEEAPAVVGESQSLPIDDASGPEFGRHVMKCHEELAQLEGPNQEIFAKITEQLANELNIDTNNDPNVEPPE